MQRTATDRRVSAVEITYCLYLNNMSSKKPRQASDTWNEGECKAIIAQLWALRESMQAYEASLAPFLPGIDSSYKASARNLAHYLALRHSDRRCVLAPWCEGFRCLDRRRRGWRKKDFLNDRRLQWLPDQVQTLARHARRQRIAERGVQCDHDQQPLEST